jgi:hypothetical protein
MEKLIKRGIYSLILKIQKMNIKIYLTIALLSVIVAIATVNVSLAKVESSSSSSTLANFDLLALGESFFFDGQEWNDTDTHSYAARWKPVLIKCTGYAYDGQGNRVSSWPGKMIQCQSGNGNCNHNASYYPCIGNPAQ